MNASGSLDLEHLGLDAGAHLLLERALRDLPPGGTVTVVGTDPALPVHLPAWCRQRGHALTTCEGGWVVARGPAQAQRWHADEARHVAFGIAHLAYQARTDSRLLGRLRAAAERRHGALAGTG